jgi:hypothetical protein
MSALPLFRYFKTSPEIIRLAVMMYVRYPLSLRNVEDLLHERGIDVTHETVRFWCLLRSVLGRRIDPAAAGLQHMDDAAEHAPVIHPRLAPGVRGKMRRDLRKLHVRQPEMIPIHRSFLLESVNHNWPTRPIILWSGP